MTRIKCLALALPFCALAACAGCTTAQIARAERICAQAAAAGATAEQRAGALAAFGVPAAKIAAIGAEIQRGEAYLTAGCAVIATLPPPSAAAPAPPAQAI